MENNMENKIDEIAQGIADITLELMRDSVDWQLEDFPLEGDEYRYKATKVLQLAIKKMYLQNKYDY